MWAALACLFLVGAGCADLLAIGTPTYDAGAGKRPDASQAEAGTAVEGDAGCSCAPSARFGECRAGICQPAIQVGPPEGGVTDRNWSGMTLDHLYCFQIAVTGCADLTGLGLRLGYVVSSFFRLGVFEGLTFALLTQTNATWVDGTALDTNVSPVIPVGCDTPPQSHPYWVCVASDAYSVEFAAFTNTSSPYLAISGPTTQLGGWVEAGFAGVSLSQSSKSDAWIPDLYMWTVPTP